MLHIFTAEQMANVEGLGEGKTHKILHTHSWVMHGKGSGIHDGCCFQQRTSKCNNFLTRAN